MTKQEFSFDALVFHTELNKVRYVLCEKYRDMILSSSQEEIYFADLEDDDTDETDLPMVVIHKKEYHVVSADIEFITVIPIDSPMEEDETKIESFNHIDTERDMIYLLSEIQKKI